MFDNDGKDESAGVVLLRQAIAVARMEETISEI